LVLSAAKEFQCAASYLLGLSDANRQTAGVATGDEIEIELEFDAEPPTMIVPEDFARRLDTDPVARAAYDRLPCGRNGSTCALSRVRRIPRRASGGSKMPCQHCRTPHGRQSVMLRAPSYRVGEASRSLSRSVRAVVW
jgi:hypothetical protein